MPDITPFIANGSSLLACWFPGCGASCDVQWRRRSAEDSTHTDAVYACGPHAITMDAAAHVHQPGCSAPAAGGLPGCGCTPEPLPAPLPLVDPTVVLSTGWTVPAP